MLLLGIIVYLKFRIDWVPICFFILYYYYEHMCIICMCRHLFHSTQVKVRGHISAVCSLLLPSCCSVDPTQALMHERQALS